MEHMPCEGRCDWLYAILIVKMKSTRAKVPLRAGNGKVRWDVVPGEDLVDASSAFAQPCRTLQSVSCHYLLGEDDVLNMGGMRLLMRMRSQYGVRSPELEDHAHLLAHISFL